MPQMYPLSWMLMMPLSIFVLWIYLVLVYYLIKYLKYQVKFYNQKNAVCFWEW